MKGRPAGAVRAVLFHPPPWKIPGPWDYIAQDDNGPPMWSTGKPMDGDQAIASYGLMSLAAQAMRAGYDVRILNISRFRWSVIEDMVAGLEADVFGISMHASSYRGVDALSRLIKQRHPRAKVVIGGPQATALPRESLVHLPAVDLVVVGEGEETFLDILDHVRRGRMPRGIDGTLWRAGDRIEQAGPRAYVDELDTLAAPQDYFSTKVLMTSRGCPMRCTFCGSRIVWGRAIRYHSADYILDRLQANLARRTSPYLAVKDDTFTVNKKRVHAICDGIIGRGLDFLWSCDTRADCLDEDILRHMREAGCQNISLGVESGSPAILQSMKKNQDLEQVLKVRRWAGKYGIRCRFFMIMGAPAETMATLEESRAFLDLARPNQAVFSVYTIYPGTEDYETARAGGVTGDAFFAKDLEFIHCHPEPVLRTFRDWHRRQDLRFRHYGVEDCKAVAERLPGLAAAHADLAAALLREGRADEARPSLERARELNYPARGLLDNMEGVMAFAQGDADRALALFEGALADHPYAVAAGNRDLLKAWLAGGGKGGASVTLQVDSELDNSNWLVQPETPAALDPAALSWPRRGAMLKNR